MKSINDLQKGDDAVVLTGFMLSTRREAKVIKRTPTRITVTYTAGNGSLTRKTFGLHGWTIPKKSASLSVRLTTNESE